MEYGQACYDAAKAQGLEEIVCRMATCGVAATIEQTGGFCMVATVALGDKVINITEEGVGILPVGAESDEGWEPIPCGNTRAEIAAAVVRYVRKHWQN